MSDARPLLLPLTVVLLVVAGLLLRGNAPQRTIGGGLDGARYRLTPGAARDASVTLLAPPAPLRFAPGIAPSDQQVVRNTIATARPEARRLIELVEGLVTIRVGRPGRQIAGQMRPTADGYDVVLDLDGVYRTTGMRGVRRLTLHELAHVVDDALVPSALERELDAATGPGFGCDHGITGGCAAREERFAESFAKWATGDIGAALYLGYSVPPPTSLSGWGAPLAALAR